MEEDKEIDNPQSLKDFERTKSKKNTFQVKENHFGLKKDFESIKRNYKSRCYSTKILRDFVPQIRPKKSFCKPTFFKLDDEIESKSIDNENGKDFELDKILSCDSEDDEDDEESKNNSSSISSSEAGMDKEEEKENELNLDISSSLKEEGENSDQDEYKNLAFKKKKKHKKNVEETNTNNFNNLRKEMSKIRSRTIVVKSKEMEEIFHHLNDDFKLGISSTKNSYYDENCNKKENDINKNSIKFGNKDNNFSILDVLTIKNEKN